MHYETAGLIAVLAAVVVGYLYLNAQDEHATRVRNQLCANQLYTQQTLARLLLVAAPNYDERGLPNVASEYRKTAAELGRRTC